MYPRSMADSDCVVVQGSNMAECHPVAFRWPMQAKLKGAKLIHVDPRFTRTSAVADIHAPIRAGSDVAFLGGLVNHVLQSERWNTDPFFKEFVVRCPKPAGEIATALNEHKILPGYVLSRSFLERTHDLLVCVTELNSKAQIDQLVTALKEVA